MSFLTPWTIAIAAGLTIPPLVALYFLKLKRIIRRVPSTLLWKKAVEDLQVNAPFQRLRRSLLLLLQLLVLILAAIALGKPMFQTAEAAEGTVLLLIDQSASMSVSEADGQTRLEKAKAAAKATVDSLPPDARIMVITFCDRAVVAASFDTDKAAIKRRIDEIQQTDSTSSLAEAISLAEAYAQNLIIGGDRPGSDVGPESAAPPATVYLFSDGKIEDARTVAVERLDPQKMRVVNVGQRTDNVGIVAMDASRNYERPEYLEVTAAVQNFGDQPVTLDAVLYVDNRNVDVQTLTIPPTPARKPQPSAAAPPEPSSDTQPSASAEPDSEPPNDAPADLADRSFENVRLAAFDQIVFEGGGLIEVVLQIDDALKQDDRAWTVIDPPRRARVLLVTPGNIFLQDVLATLSVDAELMSPEDYESAADSRLAEDDRSAYEVVILDRHSTARLPQGNYLFWGAVPQIEGVSAGRIIDDEMIFDWDETHPILRHMAVATMDPITWLELQLPQEAVPIIEGERTPVLAWLTRDASQYLICAFSLIGQDDQGREYRNGNWLVTMDFVVMMQNMIQYLSSNLAVQGARSIQPGEPVTAPIPGNTATVQIHRPDGIIESLPAGNYPSIHYARTRTVGAYRLEPGLPRYDLFAVNLFNQTESDVAPAQAMTLGGETVEARAGAFEINRPAWMYFLLGILLLLILEWIVYNRRVYV